MTEPNEAVETASDDGHGAANAAIETFESAKAARLAKAMSAMEAIDIPDEENETTTTTPVAAKPAPAAEPPPPAKVTAEVAEVEPGEFDAAARREKRQREQHAAREAKIAERERAIEEKYGRIGEAEEALKLAVRNPAEFYRRLGYDRTELIAKQLWNDKLGEAAPAEFRTQTQIERLQMELEALRGDSRAELEGIRKERQLYEQQQNEQLFERYKGGLVDYCEDVPPDQPAMRAHAKAYGPEYVAGLMLEAAQAHANNSPGAAPLSAAEAAAVVERRLYRVIEAARENAPAPTPKKQQPTIRNGAAATKTRATPAATTAEERRARAIKILMDDPEW